MTHTEQNGDIPQEPKHYIVGVGASAGGLEALESFFENMPDDTGMSFVVIQHLSPDYKSLMVELLSKRTDMEVLRAEEGMFVRPNRVYLIPPKKNLTIFHGKLLLKDQAPSRGLNLPIDIFLESLAEDIGDHAIGVILSGTGSDGMRGIRAIKESSGMVMVQQEDTAKFDGMPKSAISTGLVDYVLAPENMADHLESFIKHPYMNLKDENSTILTDQDGMDMLFSLLRKRYKVDFTYYKPNTIVRRIKRRMMINHIDDFKDYVRSLESNPHEVSILHKELLIGVTHFFRDREAFDLLSGDYLRGILLENNKKELRLWVVGCSTGEEAYSMAIIVRESLEELDLSMNVKIFATDVDQEAIIFAGMGQYSESIVADVPSDLLQKYFIYKENNFHISREIREMVVFAQHDILMDPPFANIDLITCRNLLIYFQPVLQSKVLELFNYSLKEGGILFLGPSETTGDRSSYFEILNNKWKIYRSRMKASLTDPDKLRNVRITSKNLPLTNGVYRAPARSKNEEKLLERIIEPLGEDYIPATLIINETRELIYSLGDLEGFIKLPSGKTAYDITKMVPKDLSIPISTGLQKVFTLGKEIKYTNVNTTVNGQMQRITIRIKLLPQIKSQENLAVVYIIKNKQKDQVSSADEHLEYDVSREVEQRISDLENELQFTKENLQATIEELETSNEELQATNEELFASNEELQATNEELQSVNEELHTVNAEFQSKILELTETNNDLENLMDNTHIGYLFLDENLDIRKFTRPVKKIFQLVENDVGRPLDGIANLIGESNMDQIIRNVQEIESGYENEYQAKNGHWYLVKILPYEIAKDTYSGVIITSIDITLLKKTQISLRKSNIWRDEAASIAGIGGWEIDINTMKTSWTDEVYRIHEVESDFEHAVNNGIDFYAPEDKEKIKQGVTNAIENEEPFDLTLRFITAKGNHRWVRSIGRIDKNEEGIRRIFGTIQDVTDITTARESLKNINSRCSLLFECMIKPAFILDRELVINDLNCCARELFDAGDVKGKVVLELINSEHQEKIRSICPTLSDDGSSARLDPDNYFNLQNTHGLSLFAIPKDRIVICIHIQEERL